MTNLFVCLFLYRSLELVHSQWSRHSDILAKCEAGREAVQVFSFSFFLNCRKAIQRFSAQQSHICNSHRMRSRVRCSNMHIRKTFGLVENQKTLSSNDAREMSTPFLRSDWVPSQRMNLNLLLTKYDKILSPNDTPPFTSM